MSRSPVGLHLTVVAGFIRTEASARVLPLPPVSLRPAAARLSRPDPAQRGCSPRGNRALVTWVTTPQNGMSSATTFYALLFIDPVLLYRAPGASMRESRPRHPCVSRDEPRT